MFLTCKNNLQKMPRPERYLSLDIVVDSIVCCIQLIATTTTDDVGMFCLSLHIIKILMIALLHYI